MTYASGKRAVNLPPITGIYTFFEEVGSIQYPILYRNISLLVPFEFSFGS